MEKKSRRILLTMDGSHHSDDAYRWYLKYFRQPQDYVIFVHCHEIEQSQLLCFFTKNCEDLKQMMLHEESKTKLLLSRLKEHLKREGIPGKVVRKDGDPKEQLLRVSGEENVDCIITGSRGLNGKRFTPLGSVSLYLVHHSKVPVLIVKQETWS